MRDWQTIAALSLVGLAVAFAVRGLILPFFQSMKTPPKNGGCGGGCGCSSTPCATPKKTD
jgi:hypothetical protein